MKKLLFVGTAALAIATVTLPALAGTSLRLMVNRYKGTLSFSRQETRIG